MNVTHQIDINAPRRLVWSNMSDIEAWPSWTPTVTRAQALTGGGLRPGSRYRLKQPLQPPTIWEVTEVDGEQEFVWVTGNALVRLRARHRLLEIEGRTRSILSINASGIGAWFLSPILRLAFIYALKTENAGLKAVCEGRAERRAEP